MDRSVTIMRREQYMRQCRGFVDENSDLVVEFCLALGVKPPATAHIHLQYPVPSALWTCPQSRCRKLNTRAETEECDDCGTRDLDAGMRPVCFYRVSDCGAV